MRKVLRIVRPLANPAKSCYNIIITPHLETYIDKEDSIMQVMKQLVITQLGESYWEYSNGWDKIEVTRDDARSQDLHSDKNIYSISWPDGNIEEVAATPDELHGIIGTRILFPTKKKLTEAEAEAIFKKDGVIRGVVKLPLDYARGLTDALMLSMVEQVTLTADFVKESILSSQLIRALIESKHMTIGGVTTGPKYRLKSYDILGFDTEAKGIYLMIEVTIDD
ncbi:hypothetical protein IJ117_02470 [Candidatus Saccharibacteria bacterium]|nr:hypothetical protein [Candidatus Saccharibacteria bacterium]